MAFFPKETNEQRAERQRRLFLAELLDNSNRWADVGQKEYSEAYLLLLHNFTMPVEEVEVVKG